MCVLFTERCLVRKLFVRIKNHCNLFLDQSPPGLSTGLAQVPSSSVDTDLAGKDRPEREARPLEHVLAHLESRSGEVRSHFNICFLDRKGR